MKLKFTHIILFLFIILPFTPLLAGRLRPMQLYSLGSDHTLKNGEAAIFIHGTTNTFPGTEFLLGSFIDDWVLNTGRVLSQACPSMFPYNSFYAFRWAGNFNIRERKKAAQYLYDLLCDHRGPLTIIGHSHGCSIALYLAELCMLSNNTRFKVDRLILLAPPVHEQTAYLLNSPVFKKVYSLYSSADLWQIIAPERVTKRVGKRTRKVMKRSQRVFPDAPHLIQARVLVNYRSPSHLDFFCAPFLKKLPSVIAFLDQHAGSNRHVIVNIPTDETPLSFLQKEQIVHSSVPRWKRRRCKGNTIH